MFAIGHPAGGLEAGLRSCSRFSPDPFILPAMDSRHAAELLDRERARIEHQLADLAPHDSEDVEDPYEAADVGEDLFDEELGEGRAERLRDELDAIERAEQRLAEGTYGISVESGEPIPDARLEAIPWAERTAEEQARYEATGG
jgi:DnaK suppressor protein